MNDETDGRVLAQQARGALADRARLPWWFVVVQTLALLSMLGAPIVSKLVPGGWVYPVMLWAGLVVILLGQLLLQRLQGALFSSKTLRVYPSTRRSGLIFLVVFVVLVAAEIVLLLAGLPTAAVPVVIVAAVAWGVFLVQRNAAMRRDIRDGRVAGS